MAHSTLVVVYPRSKAEFNNEHNRKCALIRSIATVRHKLQLVTSEVSTGRSVVDMSQLSMYYDGREFNNI